MPLASAALSIRDGGAASGAAIMGREIMARTLVTIVVVAAGLALSACNTVRGAGQDLQSAANSVDNAMH